MELPETLSTSFTEWAEGVGNDAAPRDVLTATSVWSRLHGVVSLEIAGNFAIMTPDSDAQFELEVVSMLGLGVD